MSEACQHRDQYRDNELGIVVCQLCGIVLSENDMVHDPTTTSAAYNASVNATSRSTTAAAMANTGSAIGLYHPLTSQGLIRPRANPGFANAQAKRIKLSEPENPELAIISAPTQVQDGRITAIEGGELEEENFQSYGYKSSFAGSNLAPKNTKERTNKKAADLSSKLYQYSSVLGMKSELAQIRYRLSLALQLGRFRLGQAAELVLGSCLYIQARMDKKPITLRDIADLIEQDVFVLGATYSRVKILLQIELPEMDPVLFLKKAAETLLGSDPNRPAVLESASKLLHLAKDEALFAGLKTNYVVEAALIMMTQVHSRVKVGDNPQLKQMPSGQQRCIRKLIVDLKTCLLQKSNVLPWAADINDRNLFEHIPDILKSFWVIKARDREKRRLKASQDQEAYTAPFNNISKDLIGPRIFKKEHGKRITWEQKIDRADHNLRMLGRPEGIISSDLDQMELLKEDETVLQDLLLLGMTVVELKQHSPLDLTGLQELLQHRKREVRDQSRQRASNELDAEELIPEDLPEDDLHHYLLTTAEVAEKAKIYERLDQKKKA